MTDSLSPHRAAAKPEHGWTDQAIDEVTEEARTLLNALRNVSGLPDLGAVCELLTAIDRSRDGAIELIDDALRYYCGTDW